MKNNRVEKGAQGRPETEELPFRRALRDGLTGKGRDA